MKKSIKSDILCGSVGQYGGFPDDITFPFVFLIALISSLPFDIERLEIENGPYFKLVAKVFEEGFIFKKYLGG